MNSIVTYLIPIALTAVAVILALGLLNMLKGGSPNRSQKFMRMRVAAQFVAIVAMVAALYFSGRA